MHVYCLGLHEVCKTITLIQLYQYVENSVKTCHFFFLWGGGGVEGGGGWIRLFLVIGLSKWPIAKNI